MSDNFKRALEVVLRHEGGFVDHPSDPGGATNYGITVAVARENGYRGDMREIPMEIVRRIYFERYWNQRYDLLPFTVAFNIFDGNANSGVGRSVRWIQQACHAKIDGLFGPKTQELVLSANPDRLVLDYNSIRLDFLCKLGTWPTFGRGWARRIASNLAVR